MASPRTAGVLPSDGGSRISTVRSYRQGAGQLRSGSAGWVRSAQRTAQEVQHVRQDGPPVQGVVAAGLEAALHTTGKSRTVLEHCGGQIILTAAIDPLRNRCKPRPERKNVIGCEISRAVEGAVYSL